MGEDVHRLRGGVSGATKAALERWPERGLSMPIAENGFVGAALGAALCGLRPVVEVMFGDFCLVAADQLFNQTAKIRHMFGGRFGIPMVLRVRVSLTQATDRSTPATERVLCRVSRLADRRSSYPVRLCRTYELRIAVQRPGFGHRKRRALPNRGACSGQYARLLHPIRAVQDRAFGNACTVVVSGSMVEKAREAAELTGIDAEIIDLRTLIPRGWTGQPLRPVSGGRTVFSSPNRVRGGPPGEPT